MHKWLGLLLWAVVFASTGAALTYFATMRAVRQGIDKHLGPESCQGMTSAGLCGKPYAHEGECS